MRNAARVLALVVVLAVLFSGCNGNTVSFTRKGLTLTLPDDFVDLTDKEYNIGSFDFLYVNYDIELCGLKESKAELEPLVGAVDAAGYAQVMIDLNKLDCEVQQTGGLYNFSYEQTIEDVTNTYLCVVHENGDSLWLLSGYCASQDYLELQSDMWQYLSNVKFTE